MGLPSSGSKSMKKMASGPHNCILCRMVLTVLIHRKDHSRCESRTMVPPWGNPTAAQSGVNQIEQSLCDPLVILRMLSILVGWSMRKASGGIFGAWWSWLELRALIASSFGWNVVLPEFCRNLANFLPDKRDLTTRVDRPACQMTFQSG
jgi:hypothetical protein